MQWIPSTGYYRKVLLSEKELESPGNVVQLLKVEAGGRIVPHHHGRTAEIFYVLKGQVILFVGDNDSLRRPGDIIFCKPNERHGIVNDSNSAFVVIVFLLNAAKDDTYRESKISTTRESLKCWSSSR